MSHSQFHSIDLFILRHAWLNLWDKRMLLAESTRLLSFVHHRCEIIVTWPHMDGSRDEVRWKSIIVTAKEYTNAVAIILWGNNLSLLTTTCSDQSELKILLQGRIDLTNTLINNALSWLIGAWWSKQIIAVEMDNTRELWSVTHTLPSHVHMSNNRRMIRDTTHSQHLSFEKLFWL